MTPHILDQVEFAVEAGKIGEFARATPVADSVHQDDGAATTAGFGARAATPTHVVVAGHHRDQQAMVSTLDLDLARIVVGSVRFSYARALVAGDHLVGTRRVIADERRDSRDGTSMRLITLLTEYVDVTHTPVVRVREVIIERGAIP
jgi:hypothetical protein